MNTIVENGKNIRNTDTVASSYLSISMNSLISTNQHRNSDYVNDDQYLEESHQKLQIRKLRNSLEKPSLKNGLGSNLKGNLVNSNNNNNNGSLVWSYLEQYHNKQVYMKAKAYSAAQNNKQLFYEMLFKLVLNYLLPAEIFKLLQVSRQFRDTKFKSIIESRMEFLITNENILYYQSMFNSAMQIDNNRKIIIQQYQHFSKMNNQYDEVIGNDVDRTFQDQDFFKSPRNKLCLTQILKAFSSSNSQLGYIQGINYLAAVLLSIMPPEEAYWVTKQFLEKYNYGELFVDQFKNLQLFIFQTSCFFKNFIPDLFNHMKIFSVQYEITIQRWFLSFFANDIDIQLMIKILNLFIFKGFKSIIKAVLALFSLHRKKLLQLRSQEDIYEYLQDKFSEYPISHVLFLREMKRFKVTRRLLEECAYKYKKIKNNQIPLFDLIKTSHSTLEWFNVFGTNSPVNTTKYKTRQKRSIQSTHVSSQRERILTNDSAREIFNKSSRDKNSNNNSLLNLSGYKHLDSQPQKREHSVTYTESNSYCRQNQILTLKKYSSRDIYENNYQTQQQPQQNKQNELLRMDSYKQLEGCKGQDLNNIKLISRNSLKVDPNEDERSKELKLQALLQPSTSESEDEKTNKPLESQLNHQSFKEFRSITNPTFSSQSKLGQSQQQYQSRKQIGNNVTQPNQSQLIYLNLNYASNKRDSSSNAVRTDGNNPSTLRDKELNFQKKQQNNNDTFNRDSLSYKDLPNNSMQSIMVTSKKMIDHTISQGNLSQREQKQYEMKSLTPRTDAKESYELNYLEYLKQPSQIQKMEGNSNRPASYNPGRFFKDHQQIQEEKRKKLLDQDTLAASTIKKLNNTNPNTLNTSGYNQLNTLPNQSSGLNTSKLKQRPERDLSANSQLNGSSSNVNNLNQQNSSTSQANNVIQYTSYSNYLQLNQSLNTNQIEKIKDIYKQNYSKIQLQQQQIYMSNSNNQVSYQNPSQPSNLKEQVTNLEKPCPSHSMHIPEEEPLSRKHGFSLLGNSSDNQNTTQNQIQSLQYSTFTQASAQVIQQTSHQQAIGKNSTTNQDSLSKLNPYQQQIHKSYSQMAMNHVNQPNQQQNNLSLQQINQQISTTQQSSLQQLPSTLQGVTNQQQNTHYGNTSQNSATQASNVNNQFSNSYNTLQNSSNVLQNNQSIGNHNQSSMIKSQNTNNNQNQSQIVNNSQREQSNISTAVTNQISAYSSIQPTGNNNNNNQSGTYNKVQSNQQFILNSGNNRNQYTDQMKAYSNLSSNNHQMMQTNNQQLNQNSNSNFNDLPLSSNQNIQNQYQPSSQQYPIQQQQEFNQPQQTSQLNLQQNNSSNITQQNYLPYQKITPNIYINQQQSQQASSSATPTNSQLQHPSTFQSQYMNQHSSQSLQKPQASQSQQKFNNIQQQTNQQSNLNSIIQQQKQQQQQQSQQQTPLTYQLQSQYSSNQQYKYINVANQQTTNKQNQKVNGSYTSPNDSKQQKQPQSKSNLLQPKSLQQTNVNSQNKFTNVINSKCQKSPTSDEAKQLKQQEILNIIQLQLNQNQQQYLKVNSYQNQNAISQNSQSQLKKTQPTTINSNKQIGIQLLSANNSNNISSSNYQASFFQNQNQKQIPLHNQQNTNTSSANTGNNLKSQLQSQCNSNYNSNNNSTNMANNKSTFQQQIQISQHQFVSLVMNQQKQTSYNEDLQYQNNQNILNNAPTATNSHLQKLQERKQTAKFTSFSLTQNELASMNSSKIQQQQQQATAGFFN